MSQNGIDIENRTLQTATGLQISKFDKKGQKLRPKIQNPELLDLGEIKKRPIRFFLRTMK